MSQNRVLLKQELLANLNIIYSLKNKKKTKLCLIASDDHLCPRHHIQPHIQPHPPL
jgi:hypothetical protein